MFYKGRTSHSSEAIYIYVQTDGTGNTYHITNCHIIGPSYINGRPAFSIFLPKSLSMKVSKDSESKAKAIAYLVR